MVLLGCTPKGRFTEQHDVFFGIGTSLHSLKKDISAFWPEVGDDIHIDAWREVNYVDGFRISVVHKSEPGTGAENIKLFFINLGGYRHNEFEEFHYKMIVAAPDKGSAIRESKKTVFYKHVGIKGAESHVDDKYGIDVDDLHEIQDILPAYFRTKYRIVAAFEERPETDTLNLGYLMFSKI